MSLTPEQITAQNFKDFYDGLKPYLNSYIPFQSHFNRGDLYSTDEKIIGQWIDGKPLYQKFIDCGVQSASETTVTVDHNISNIESAFIKHAFMTYATQSAPFTEIIPLVNSTSDFVGRVYVDATKVNIKQQGGWSSYHAYVILCYTKTTDSVTNIGLDTDYSTDEKIVGTWVDGKPIYQKTIAVTTKSSAGWSSGVAHGISNIDKIINLNCVVPTSSGWTYTVGKSDVMSIMCASDSTEISVYVDHQELHGRQVYVTIQYTKTTS